jgi:hypothetical protein
MLPAGPFAATTNSNPDSNPAPSKVRFDARTLQSISPVQTALSAEVCNDFANKVV